MGGNHKEGELLSGGFVLQNKIRVSNILTVAVNILADFIQSDIKLLNIFGVLPHLCHSGCF